MLNHATCRLKAAKYGIQKLYTCRATLLRFKFLVDVSRFSPCVINLSRNKNICCGLKKVVAQNRARVNFEQQILALLLVFHQTLSLSRNKFVVMPPSWINTKKINQSVCCICSTRNKSFGNIITSLFHILCSGGLWFGCRYISNRGFQLLSLLGSNVAAWCQTS